MVIFVPLKSVQMKRDTNLNVSRRPCECGNSSGSVGMKKRYFYELLMEVEQSKPTETLYRIMEDAGLLNALEDSPSLLFGQFRKSAIPPEETEILKQAGFSDDEIEVLLAEAVDQAHKMATHGIQPSTVIAETTVALNDAITRLKTIGPHRSKKRKERSSTGSEKSSEAQPRALGMFYC